MHSSDHWSKEETAKLVAFWKTDRPIFELTDALVGRTDRACFQKAYRLGLPDKPRRGQGSRP